MILYYLQLLYYYVQWMQISIVKLLNTFTNYKEISYMIYVITCKGVRCAK